MSLRLLSRHLHRGQRSEAAPSARRCAEVRCRVAWDARKGQHEGVTEARGACHGVDGSHSSVVLDHDRAHRLIVIFGHAQLLFASFSSCLRSFALGVPVRLLYLFHVRACKNVIISSRCFSRYLTAFVDKHVQDVHIRLLSRNAYPYCTRGRGWATRDGRRATPPRPAGQRLIPRRRCLQSS